MEIERRNIIFSGEVQGVGFRYRASYAARGLGVTGWVMNEWDGTVEMEAQGTAKQINEMLKLINQSPYIRIYDMKTKIIPVKEHENGFHIK
jgi:acylphosphatase